MQNLTCQKDGVLYFYHLRPCYNSFPLATLSFHKQKIHPIHQIPSTRPNRFFSHRRKLRFSFHMKKGHPEKFIFDRMTKFSSNIFRSSLFGENIIVFYGAAANKFLFSNENKLVQLWWPNSVNKLFPSSTQTSSKEEAIKMRKMLPNFFKPEALQRYVGIMDQITQKHFVSCWEGNDEIIVSP